MGRIVIDLVHALRRLAEPGTDASATDFVIVSNGVRVVVEYSDGSTCSLVLGTRYDANCKSVPSAAVAPGHYRASARGTLTAVRPMEISLVRETPDHVRQKASGDDFEHQTGHRAFDEAFYVSSPTTEPKVLAAVLHEGTCAAALELVGCGMDRIDIDDAGFVRVKVAGFLTTGRGAGDAENIVRAFVTLASGLPALAAAEVAHPNLPLERFVMIGAVAAMLGLGLAPFGFLLLAAAFGCTSRDEGYTLTAGADFPMLLGVVLGVVLAPLATWTLAAYTRAEAGPRSDLSRWLTMVRVVAFPLVFEIAFLVGGGLGFVLRGPR